MNTKQAARTAPIASLAVFLFSPLLATAAPVEPSEPVQRYVSVHVGLNNLANWPARVNFGGPVSDARLELQRGAHIGVAVGREQGPGRYELEYQHGRFDIERARIAAVSEATDKSGDYDVLTVNAMRDLYVGQSATVYGGVGAGVARVRLPHISLANGCKCLAEADRTGFAWQARIGAERPLGTAGQVFAQLGYLALPGPRAEGKTSITYRSRGFGVMSVGYRYHF